LASEATSYPNHVVEQTLAHVIGSQVERADRRSDLLDKRVAVMNEWSTYPSGSTAQLVRLIA
jgi:hypothetical protein